MKSRKLIVPILLAASLTLAACGGANNNKKIEDTNITKKSVSISDGAKEMKQTIADLKTQLNAKDTSKVKESGAKLEQSWQKFEDEVKGKSADLYEKVETPLHTIEAGAKAQPLDPQVLNKVADELNTVLSDVEKLK
jgi:iron uptake system EfeUOB component EfeO/EfeM